MRNTDTSNASKKCKELRLNRIKEYNLNPKRCKICNKALSYDNRINTFCSHSCSATHTNTQRGITYPKCIICGIILHTRKETTCGKCKSPKITKKYLIKIRGHKCEQCGNTHWQGVLIPLDKHHIDGNKKNNNEKNLKLLCANCHALTDNYCKHKSGCTLTVDSHPSIANAEESWG